MDFINTNDVAVWRAHQQAIDELVQGFVRPRDKPSDSLECAASCFNLIQGAVIAECGTGLQGDMSGNSMLYWFHQTNASEIHCIDLNADWINSIRDELGLNPRITYHHRDCFAVVPTIDPIDLIYMDFWIGDGHAREKAYFDLYKNANQPKMILIDDSDHSSPWKQTLIVPEAMSDGYRLIYMGRQTLLIREDVAERYVKPLENLLLYGG